MSRPVHILPVIVLSQFAGTSLWFAGNAVIGDLQVDWGLVGAGIEHVTSAVQAGFILGTLVFAYLSIADRFSPRLVFLCCALAGALANIALFWMPKALPWLLLSRFITGFFLAGIYPVGMKIAAGWYAQGLGRALGFLVGALVLGTAFPHLLWALGAQWSWEIVVGTVALLAAAGGVLMFILVPDGPYLPAGLSKGVAFNPRMLAVVFRSREFRASACGYFGHMWELYAFWAFVPPWLAAAYGVGAGFDVPFWSFAVIAAGFVGCAVGGLLSARWGSAPVAAAQLLVSGLCCVLSPWMFGVGGEFLLVFLLLWGITVVGDSPQFSALNAATAPREYVGSALTIANCIGFSITIVAIHTLGWLLPVVGFDYLFWLLLPGPVMGLLALRPLLLKS